MALVKYGKRAIKRYPAVRKRYNVYAPAVKQLASDVMYLKGLINSERKYHVLQASNNYDYNGLIFSLADIPQGDAAINRDGNSILPRYLSVNYVIGATNSASTPIVIRMILFRYWGEATSGTPSVTTSEILSTTGTQFAPLSHLNDNNTGSKGDRERRIEVLRNDLYSFDLVDKRDVTGSYNITMNNGNLKEHIKYDAAATSQPTSGGLYILVISNDATSTNARFTFESKLTFYDN